MSPPPPNTMPWCGVCKYYPNCEPRQKAGANDYLIFSCARHSDITDIRNVPLGRTVLVWVFDFSVGDVK